MPTPPKNDAQIGDPIWYHSSSETQDPNPAPAIVDYVDDNIVTCTVTYADTTTSEEVGVPPPPGPNEDYWRYWTPREI